MRLESLRSTPFANFTLRSICLSFLEKQWKLTRRCSSMYQSRCARCLFVLIIMLTQMPIDHFTSDASKISTFKNRYWINATYYEAGGPVFCTRIRINPYSSSLTRVFLQCLILANKMRSRYFLTICRYVRSTCFESRIVLNCSYCVRNIMVCPL